MHIKFFIVNSPRAHTPSGLYYPSRGKQWQDYEALQC